jgi:hypothetical protein
MLMTKSWNGGKTRIPIGQYADVYTCRPKGKEKRKELFETTGINVRRWNPNVFFEKWKITLFYDGSIFSNFPPKIDQKRKGGWFSLGSTSPNECCTVLENAFGASLRHCGQLNSFKPESVSRRLIFIILIFDSESGLDEEEYDVLNRPTPKIRTIYRHIFHRSENFEPFSFMNDLL